MMDMLVPVAHLDTTIDQLDLWEAAACRWISNPQNKDELSLGFWFLGVVFYGEMDD